jgi:transcriptional regulator with XRE-family HTH domain
LARREWVFTIRLKQARERKDLSQRRLGILMGIHEDSASSRINQYEHGKHEPDYGTVQRLAEVLEVPTAYFYAENDVVAELILRLNSLSDTQKRKVLRNLSADKTAAT